MGKLNIYCAGTSQHVLPGNSVNSILLNVPHNGATQSDINAAKELVRYAGSEHVFLDSGGFQLLNITDKKGEVTLDVNTPLIFNSKQLNITPKHVIETALKIRPQKMSALDFPIRKFTNKTEQEAEFQYKLPFNVQFALETVKLRDKFCRDIDIFIPVQCYSLGQFNTFISEIQGVNFEGLCMPTRNANPEEMVSFLNAFMEIGVKQVHLLGTTSFSSMAIAGYMARHFFDWVSMDSTSWRLSAEYSCYSNPLNLKNEFLMEGSHIKPEIIQSCSCPWCQYRDPEDIKNMDYYGRRDFLRCHNWYTTENIAKEIFNNAGSLKALEQFLKSRTKDHKKIEEICKALSLISPGTIAA